MSFGDRHHRGIGKPEIEIRMLCIELGRAAKKGGGHLGDPVLAGGQRGEQKPRRARADPRADEVIGLRDHRHGDDQIAAEPGHEYGREAVCWIAPIDRRDERGSVGDCFQCLKFGSAKISRSLRSALRLRSPGPSPEPT